MNAELINIKESLTKLSGTDLEYVKVLVDEQIEAAYYQKENFMLHEKLDDYFYEVYYNDGTYHLFCTGKQGYDEYVKNEKAVRIVRKSKDLFYTRETLLEKC